jgi:hemoglobin-like flavoprotein
MKGDHADAFRASLKRCLDDPAFMKDFYDRFTTASPEVAEKFKNTDFERQNRVLADSLYLMVAGAQGGEESIAWREMKHIALRHRELKIGPGLYDIWLSCLLGAAREHDPQWSPDLEAAWTGTLAPGITFFRTRALEDGLR